MDLVLELLRFSTVPLLYKTENIQKDFDFYQRSVKTIGLATAWVAYDVCDEEIILDAIKDLWVFNFPITNKETMNKKLLEQFNFILKMVYIPQKLSFTVRKHRIKLVRSLSF